MKANAAPVPKRPATAADRFRAFAARASEKLGSPWAFFAAVALIILWMVTGPLFNFSNAWQLVINTGTTVVTFLMVFLIQSTQNRDARAIHLKLDELIRSSKARNIFADLENATEEELIAFQQEFRKLRERGVQSGDAAERARRLTHPGTGV
ncbi:MAG TPA: low affinity iron permease family protein [Polyangia bacterium]|nr:low affinity iron permease family protein [Polyangia bacterium]